MRRPLVLLAAVTLVGGFATQSTAQDRIPPPVVVATGGCPANYRELVRIGGSVVCLSNIRPPGVRATTSGCNAGEFAVVVDGRYGVCVY